MVDGGVGEVLRAALETVLADDDGALLVLADALGDEQDAIGEDIAVDVEDDFVAGVFFFAVDQARARSGRDAGCGQAANDLIVQVFAVAASRFFPGICVAGIGSGPEALAGEFGVGEQVLGVVEQLVELALLALERIGQIAQATRGAAGGLQPLAAEG